MAAMAACEGKILGGSSIACDLCDEDTPTSYCKNCESTLCPRCIKQHSRVAATKHHNIVQLQQGKVTSSNKATKIINCRSHPGKPLDSICEDCLVTICSDCQPSHRGHKLSHADTIHLQRLSAAKIPGLIEILQELKELDDGTPAKIAMYTKARELVVSWKKRLVDLITIDADGLLNQIDDEIQRQKTSSKKTSVDVKHHISTTDTHIMKLTDARHVSDDSILLSQLSECNKDIEHAKEFLKNFETKSTTKTIDDILPQRHWLSNLEEILHKFLINRQSPSKLRQSNIARQYSKLQKTATHSLRKTGSIYRISESRRTDIIMFSPGTNQLCEFDLNQNTLNNITCPKKIQQMISFISFHVVIEHDTNDVLLLNNSYLVIVTMSRGSDGQGLTPKGLCLKGDTHFILSEVNKSGKRVRLSVVRVNDTEFTKKVLCEVDVVGHWIGLIITKGDKIIMTDDDESLCVVNISTGKKQHIDLCRKTIGCLQSLCKDDHNILLGDNAGNIHLLQRGKYKDIVMKMARRTTGVASRGEKVVILMETEILVYE